jgi:pathogenicity locus Cdd1 protein
VEEYKLPDSVSRRFSMQNQERRLADLISIGPAMLRDFEILKIRSVGQLSRQNPRKLYDKLCRAKKQHIDICCLDVFTAAVAQARDPLLSAEKCQWWYWSRKRKAGGKAGGKENDARC